MQFQLLENNKNRFLSLFNEINEKSPSIKGYMMVLDEQSAKIISSHFKLSELLEKNILSIEKLELNRKPFPKMQAIYFLSPDSEIIQKFIADFPNKDAKYKNAHLIFSNQLSQNLLQLIGKSSALPYIKTMKEFNLEYQVKDQNCFSLLMNNFLKSMVEADLGEIDVCANKLFTVIPSLLKYQEFEIIYNQSENQTSYKIAIQLHKRLLSHLKYLDSKKSEILDKESGKVTICILDRSLDPLSPLMHDFYYQSLFYDLLPIQNDSIEIQNKQQEKQGEKQDNLKKVNIAQNDLFKKYKFEHFADALSNIPKEMQTFMKENSAAKLQKGEIKNLDLKDMTSIITQMPQYQEKIGSFQININLMEQILKIIEQNDIKQLADIEQSLATGIDSKGSTVKEKEIFELLLRTLQSSTISLDLKKRLILISILTLSLSDETRRKITDTLSGDQQKIITNLQLLGVKIQQTGAKLALKVEDSIKKLVKEQTKESTLELNRYIPLSLFYIEKIIDQISKKKTLENDKNSNIKFESISINKSEQQQITKKQGILGKLINNDQKSIDGQQKLIVFIAGGISYQEIRAIKQKTSKLDFQTIVGGSSFISPQDYISQIEKLSM